MRELAGSATEILFFPNEILVSGVRKFRYVNSSRLTGTKNSSQQRMSYMVDKNKWCTDQALISTRTSSFNSGNSKWRWQSVSLTKSLCLGRFWLRSFTWWLWVSGFLKSCNVWNQKRLWKIACGIRVELSYMNKAKYCSGKGASPVHRAHMKRS